MVLWPIISVPLLGIFGGFISMLLIAGGWTDLKKDLQGLYVHVCLTIVGCALLGMGAGAFISLGISP